MATKLTVAFVGIALLAPLAGALAYSQQAGRWQGQALEEARTLAKTVAIALDDLAGPGFQRGQRAATARERARIQAFVDSLRTIEARDIVVVGASQEILAGAEVDEVGTTYVGDGAWEVAATVQDGNLRTFVGPSAGHPDGTRQVVVPLETEEGARPGAVILEYGGLYEAAAGRGREIAIGVGTLSAIGLVGALLIGLRLGRGIRSRLEAMSGAAAAIAAGDYSQRLPTRPSDELGTLAGSMNEMADRLEERMLAEARLAAVVRSSPDAIVATHTDGTVRAWSVAASRLFRWSPKEVIGRPIGSLLGGAGEDEMAELFERAAGGEVAAYEAELRRKDDSSFAAAITMSAIRGEHDELLGFSQVVRDVTEQKRSEKQLLRLAFYDPLTGLANRHLFQDRLEQAVKRSAREPGVAVLLLDLDDFKEVNDTIGHDAGDLLLVEVGRRIQSVLRPADSCARLGGDEFAVLLHDGGQAGAEHVASRLVDVLRRPVEIDHRELLPHASIGVVAHERESVAELLKAADTAMYQAKEAGGNQWSAFEAATHAKVVARLHRASELRGALQRDEFCLHYQPIVRIGSGATIGFEALARWEHPELGTVGPAEFIDLAEQSGLIVDLGRWVLRTACGQVLAWQEIQPPGEPTFSISVNVSPRQLRDSQFVEVVRETLSDVGLNPSLLTLELTETALMTDVDSVARKLYELRALGVRVAIDDFGTGYSSLGYLRWLPVDAVKIDRSFTQGITDTPQEWAIAAAITRLVRSLGLTPVAEGIEQASQLAHLRSIGCELGQGYYFSRPLPPDQIPSRLMEGGRRGGSTAVGAGGQGA